jgi:hypothetical protein
MANDQPIGDTQTSPATTGFVNLVKALKGVKIPITQAEIDQTKKFGTK